MPVTPSGIAMPVSTVQPEKASFPMLVTPDSMVTDVISACTAYHGVFPAL